MSAEQEENAIRAISRQVDRMNTLTEDLLAVSLIDSGRSSPTFELVDVAAIAHEVATDLDPHDGVHRLSVSIPDSDGASPPTDGPRDGRVPGSASRAGGSLR